MPMMPCEMPKCILGVETRHVCLGWCVKACMSFTSHEEFPHDLSCKNMHAECGALQVPSAGNGAHGAHMDMWSVPWVSKGCHGCITPQACHRMGTLHAHGPSYPHVWAYVCVLAARPTDTVDGVTLNPEPYPNPHCFPW